LRIRDWGADFVFIHGVVEHSNAVLRDAERLGMLDEIQFICGASSLPYDIMELAGSLTDGQWILWWGS
jgi:hypothetical protein